MNKHITGAKELIQTHYDEFLVFVFKTDIDWPWLFAGFPATEYNLYWDIWVYVLKSKSTLQFVKYIMFDFEAV